MSQMKRSSPGPTSKAAVRDPYVELDVSGRQLTDDGFAELAHGLLSSINVDGEHGRVVRLEELSMADNDLTAGCLRPLGRTIRLATDDLRELDLSGNNITVATSEEASAWEEFLRSFQGCCVLRRLDFSGNPLGPRAFEIFTRVYGREKPFDLLAAENDDPNVLRKCHTETDDGSVYDSNGGLDNRMEDLRIVSEYGDNVQQSLSGESRRRDNCKGQRSQELSAFSADR